MMLTRIFISSVILGMILGDYIIRKWNRCSGLPYVELHNIDLRKCMLECGYRHVCKGIQFSRQRKTCGILSLSEISTPLDVCPGSIYIERNAMQLTADDCGPYKRSMVENICITECEMSENPREYSEVFTTVNPTVGTRVKIVCDHSLEEMLVTCKRNGHFDRLPDCDTYKGTNLAFQRNTSQSSMYKDFGSDRAVDDDYGTKPQSGGCAHTRGRELRPWLVIELEHAFYLQQIQILRRTDCCEERLIEVYIYTSTNKDELMPYTVWDAGILCAYRQGPFTEQPVIFHCAEGVRGKYVKIVLNTTGSLELCDVKIYGHLSQPEL